MNLSLLRDKSRHMPQFLKKLRPGVHTAYRRGALAGSPGVATSYDSGADHLVIAVCLSINSLGCGTVSCLVMKPKKKEFLRGNHATASNYGYVVKTIR